MSAERDRRRDSAASRAIAAGVALAFALAVAACGVKSSPKHPEGSTFPKEYPASGDAKAASDDKTKQQDVVPPPGMQYDYPNRPPPR